MTGVSAERFVVRALTAEEAAARIPELSAVLVDCVEGGASVSFMAPLARETADAFWRKAADGVAAGTRILLVAEDGDGAIIGTVQVIYDLPENQPHRADVAKMLVRRTARRRGLGAALMRAAADGPARPARRCSCWTPSRAATPSACTRAWAGPASA